MRLAAIIPTYIIRRRFGSLDSNEFLFKSLRHYIRRNLISSPLPSRTSKESAFWSDITSRPDGPVFLTMS